MLRKVIALAALGLAISAGPALAAGGAEAPKHVEFSFEGPFGQFDQAQLQRGYKVYREVCAACHGMNLVSFRNLGQKHGPFYDPKYPNPNDNPYVRAIAAEYQINDIDSETGDVIQRAASSADRFPDPYPNEPAARAGNGGALPPDLSVIIKARHHGPQYVYSILTGYENPPAGLNVTPGQYYNPYMLGDLTAFWTGDHHSVPVGGFIAMPPPLQPDGVTFDDGTRATVEQQAKDVVAFLAWASEPKMIERKQFGLAAMIYLVLLAGLVYASYRRIWRNVAH
ncbi:MAG: cytochrome c1 [Phenylobacterium sp.]|jgi:ubiquinol-cytochrome c reductase cytochrome c1 subunit|uniref:cytochrome c1 n=1 Tax=Phenylobacterium sp. TaxID=1871053 RepID=UPI002A3422D1|nr:cytochrome c1 [Phenylobacterium sp.]MDD3837957.1 cytochrome c1 [Phenylobacterium sp.]MDX9997662.1 cytochrome c1 [Phenylobacterium sp.]